MMCFQPLQDLLQVINFVCDFTYMLTTSCFIMTVFDGDGNLHWEKVEEGGASVSYKNPAKKRYAFFSRLFLFCFEGGNTLFFVRIFLFSYMLRILLICN